VKSYRHENIAVLDSVTCEIKKKILKLFQLSSNASRKETFLQRATTARTATV